LLTATEVQGDFGSLSPAGLVALGASGFIVNVVFCSLGWWMLRRRQVASEFRLFAWFMFAVNGLLVTTKMMIEPMIGVGDWMTILEPLPWTTSLRVLVAVSGAGGVGLMVRWSGAALARLLPSGRPAWRSAEARRIVLLGALGAAVLVFGSSVASPVGTTRSLLLALGGGLGPFVPMLFTVRSVQRTPEHNTGPFVAGSRLWFLATGLAIFLMWFVFGPGIDLARLLS